MIDRKTVVLVLQMAYIGYVEIHQIQLHILVSIELLHMVMESMWHLLLPMIIRMLYEVFDAGATSGCDTFVRWYKVCLQMLEDLSIH